MKKKVYIKIKIMENNDLTKNLKELYLINQILTEMFNAINKEIQDNKTGSLSFTLRFNFESFEVLKEAIKYIRANIIATEGLKNEVNKRGYSEGEMIKDFKELAKQIENKFSVRSKRGQSKNI